MPDICQHITILILNDLLLKRTMGKTYLHCFGAAPPENGALQLLSSVAEILALFKKKPSMSTTPFSFCEKKE
jgi:hypothetical protein